MATVAACGGGSGSGATVLPGPTPVQASGFSNATLSGTYGITFTGANTSANQLNFVGDAAGTLTFYGNGNITSGSETEYTSGGTCSLTFSGTYDILATGALQATVTSSTQSQGCVGGTSQFAGEVSTDGGTAVFAESDGATTGGFLSGTAVKQ